MKPVRHGGSVVGDIVNLNKFRKERQREAEKKAARDNRVRFGRAGIDKAVDRARLEKAEKTLDGKKRDGDESTPGTPAPKAR